MDGNEPIEQIETAERGPRSNRHRAGRPGGIIVKDRLRPSFADYRFPKRRLSKLLRPAQVARWCPLTDAHLNVRGRCAFFPVLDRDAGAVAGTDRGWTDGTVGRRSLP